MDQEMRRALREGAGDAQAEVEWLGLRMRSGELSEERLVLLGLLGEPSARRLLGDSKSLGLWELLPRLCADLEVGVRSSLALAVFCLGVLHELRPSPWISVGCRPPLAAAARWASCPCLHHAEEAAQVAAGGKERAEAADRDSRERGDWVLHMFVNDAHFLPAAIALGSGLPEPTPQDPYGPEVEGLLVAAAQSFSTFPGGRGSGRQWTLELTALRAALVPWMLGQNDPVLRWDEDLPV
jgi:hypothetical protein